MAETELERIYTIPLRKVKAGSRNGRADRAVREVRAYLERHMKSDDIWIDDAVNQAIWARGKFTVPSRVRVRAVKFDDGVVEVSLPEEEAMSSIREQLKEEREAKVPILPTAEGEGEDDSESAEIEAEAEGEIEAEPEGETEADAEAEDETEHQEKAKPDSDGPESRGATAKEAKAPKSVRTSDEQAGAKPEDGGAQRHDHAEDSKASDVDKAEKDRH